MQLQVNLTIKQIYAILCPKCREKLLELAAKSANIDFVKQSLKDQFEAKEKATSE